MMETQTRGKRTIDYRLRGSIGTLDNVNPTRLSKQSQAVPLQLPLLKFQLHFGYTAKKYRPRL